ncbi:hypothetical protein ACFQQB_54705 [Nonomuraea rubra]|uniref:hypothetical protein n=1 Tax=Nonomuraea rubra TaxID=46180 RepID=UPI0036144C02
MREQRRRTVDPSGVRLDRADLQVSEGVGDDPAVERRVVPGATATGTSVLLIASRQKASLSRSGTEAVVNTTLKVLSLRTR